MTAPIIACRNVWKFYGATHDGDDSAAGLAALKDATFDIYPGECFVIMGLSGSGKSTLVRCITRLIEPSRGQVTIEGIDVTAASASELTDIRRRFMGMVFQHFALLPHLTVLDNVAFPLSIRGVGPDERRRRAGELLSLVGLSGREGHYPRELSGGQQQRVGIARALATDPPILFMDEPFSSLDPLLRRELQNEFAGLRERLRKTIVFITHDFDEAIRLADRIAIMRDGKILEIGTPEDLIIHSRHPYVREFTKHADRKNVIGPGPSRGPPIRRSLRPSRWTGGGSCRKSHPRSCPQALPWASPRAAGSWASLRPPTCCRSSRATSFAGRDPLDRGQDRPSAAPRRPGASEADLAPGGRSRGFGLLPRFHLQDLSVRPDPAVRRLGRAAVAWLVRDEPQIPGLPSVKAAFRAVASVFDLLLGFCRNLLSSGFRFTQGAPAPTFRPCPGSSPSRFSRRPATGSAGAAWRCSPSSACSSSRRRATGPPRCSPWRRSSWRPPRRSSSACSWASRPTGARDSTGRWLPCST
jgi:glycine betaine/proline transport system ATP-binding protein